MIQDSAGSYQAGGGGGIDHWTTDGSPRDAFARSLTNLVDSQKLRPLDLHPSSPLTFEEMRKAAAHRRVAAMFGAQQQSSGGIFPGGLKPLRWSDQVQVSVEVVVVLKPLFLRWSRVTTEP